MESGQDKTKGRGNPMPYIRKTVDVYVVQGYYGSLYGWEDTTEEETRREGMVRLREYRENQPDIPFRLRMKREPKAVGPY